MGTYSPPIVTTCIHINAVVKHCLSHFFLCDSYLAAKNLCLVMFNDITITGLKCEILLCLFYKDPARTMPRPRRRRDRSDSILRSIRKKTVHDWQQRGPDVKQFRRDDVIANGQRAGSGHRNKQIQLTSAVKKKPASTGRKKTMSIQGEKVSMSCTSNRYYTNTKAIKDMLCFKVHVVICIWVTYYDICSDHVNM